MNRVTHRADSNLSVNSLTRISKKRRATLPAPAPHDILSQGNYSLFERKKMLKENKNYARKILYDFSTWSRFDPALFPSAPASVPTP
jgi:hypothetical protein